MNRVLQNLASAILVVCAVLVTGAVVKREFLGSSSARSLRRLSLDEWNLVLSGGHRTGPAEASVRIVEFFDLQCPFCARLAPILDSIMQLYHPEVSVIHRHLPLDIVQPHARSAAIAAECAASQHRFGEFVSHVCHQQDSIGIKPWTRFALEAGVRSQSTFIDCMDSEMASAAVAADLKVATRLGFTGTPTVIVNQNVYSGALPFTRFREEIDAAMER